MCKSLNLDSHAREKTGVRCKPDYITKFNLFFAAFTSHEMKVMLLLRSTPGKVKTERLCDFSDAFSKESPAKKPSSSRKFVLI